MRIFAGDADTGLGCVDQNRWSASKFFFLENITELETIESVESAEASNASSVARSAALLSVGNGLSRVLGLARELVIADLFGATGLVSILRVALIVPTMVYDLLVGGLISAALVPVFSDYFDETRRDELWHIASVMISLTVVALAVITLLFEIFTSQLVWALGSGYDESLQQAAVGLVRIILPATIFLGVSGIVAALLYALKRFRYPAFTAALFNLSIVVCALVLSRWFGIASVVIGVLVGAIGQLALQAPGLRDFRFRPSFDWQHPALRKILKLYAPVVAGLVIGNLQIGLDRNLASHTGAQSVAWMQNATTLIQFPLGLVVTAVSLAILPTLAQVPRSGSSPRADFHSTLALGLKWILLVILPATLLLLVLAEPVVALLFEHGAFTATDTAQTANALRFYLIGLPFAAIDQPLVFAFYARKDTLRPALIGVAGVVIYLIVALALIDRFGMIGLVVANSAQLTGHAFLMLWLLQTRLGGLGGQGMIGAGAKILGAAVVMALGAAGTFAALTGLFSLTTLSGKFGLTFIPLASALLVYFAVMKMLRVREMDDLLRAVWSRVRR